MNFVTKISNLALQNENFKLKKYLVGVIVLMSMERFARIAAQGRAVVRAMHPNVGALIVKESLRAPGAA